VAARSPADVPERRARLYQRLRRTSLFASLLFMLLVPLLHLIQNVADSAGVTTSPWTGWVRGLPNLGRPAASGAPWSVGLYGLELLDPLATLGLLAARSFSWSWLLGAVPAVVLVVFLGRYFCGWICPYALVVGASNAARSLLAKLGVRTYDLKVPPATAYGVLLILLLATAVTGQQVASLFYPPAVIGRALGKVILFGSAGAGAVFIGALFLFDTFVSRAGFCRSFCPGGAVFRLLSIPSPVKVVRDAPACTNCGACDVVCNFAQSPMTDRLDQDCERCGKCVAVCPTDALGLVLIGGGKKSPGART
jgi:ferredoxin-type protein NapH